MMFSKKKKSPEMKKSKGGISPSEDVADEIVKKGPGKKKSFFMKKKK